MTERQKPSLWRTLYFQVLVGIVAGILFAYLWPKPGASLKPLGDAFIALVRMMVTPVVFCVIASGITGLDDTKEIGKTLAKAMVLFYFLTALALVFGLAAVYAFHPGVGMNIDPAHLDPSVAARYTKQAAPMTFGDFLMHAIPRSFLGPFADGEVLPVLLLAIIVGIALKRIGKAGEPVRKVIESFSLVLFAAFDIIIKLSPIGAFGAIAFTVGTYGLKSLAQLGALVGTYYLGSVVFLVIVIGALAWMHGFSCWRMVHYFRDELLIIFGTSTSEPVLPRLIEKLEQLGCQKGIVGMALPLSYSFNLDGIAIFLSVASVFIAQACNIHLSFERVLIMLLMMLLTSKGAAGVAGSGFVALIATLTVMPDIPIAGVAMIIGVDRFMSGMRAVTSTVSNCVATVVIAKWEHALDAVALQSELKAEGSARSQAITR